MDIYSRLQPNQNRRAESNVGDVAAVGDTAAIDRCRILEALFRQRQTIRELEQGERCDSEAGPASRKSVSTEEPDDNILPFGCDEEVDSDEQICVICLDKLRRRDIVFGSSCPHGYHYACILDWVKRKRPTEETFGPKLAVHKSDGCPICRQPMWDDVEYKFFETMLKQQDDAKSNISSDSTVHMASNDTISDGRQVSPASEDRARHERYHTALHAMAVVTAIVILILAVAFNLGSARNEHKQP